VSFGLEKQGREDGAKQRPAQTPADRLQDVIQGVMSTENGREFVKLILDEFSINQTPLPGVHAKVQRTLPPVEAVIYNTAQQDVVRWLIGLLRTHAPTQSREMLIESYVRGFQEKAKQQEKPQ
jgi:hypothetical protein